jgi:hypothetical protein
MSHLEIAIEATHAGNEHLLALCGQARQGSELARRTLLVWERWALQHRTLRLQGLYGTVEVAA